MKLNELENDVLEIVKSRTKDNPVSMKTLAELCGVSKREIRLAVSRLREEYPVCSSMSYPSGYFIGNVFDVAKNVSTLNSVGETYLQTAENLALSSVRFKPLVRINLPEGVSDDVLHTLCLGYEEATRQYDQRVVQVINPYVYKNTIYGGMQYVTCRVDGCVLHVLTDFVEWVGYKNEF